MNKTLIGSKIGMTSIFSENGMFVPVTVIKIEDNKITQIKNIKNDGYEAVQVTTGNKPRLKKPENGHLMKSGVSTGIGLWEFRVKNTSDLKLGEKLTIKELNAIKKVDITGITKGKGFSGTVKRWNFSTQDASHGNSLSHRVPGSIGQNQTPGRVLKGKKMSGHLGNVKVTLQNLRIINIIEKDNLILIKGSVPGVIGSNLIIRPAIKA